MHENPNLSLCVRQASSEPVFRGRKLVLNYTSGSPCNSPSTRSLNLLARDHDDHDDDDDDEKKHDDEGHDNDRKNDTRLKSTIIYFQCERDALAPKVHLSFIAASQDECTYFFEARSMAACGGVDQTEQSLSPGGVFGVMYSLLSDI